MLEHSSQHKSRFSLRAITVFVPSLSLIVATVVAAALAALVQPAEATGQEARERFWRLIENEGHEAAVEWYREVVERPEEAENLGAGPDVLVSVGDRLLADGRGEALLAVGHLGIEVHEAEPRLHFLHGEGHRLVGELRESIQAHQRTLEVEEGYEPSAARLREIWGGAEPRPLGDVIADPPEVGGYPAVRNRFFDMRRDMDQTGAYDFSPSGVLREVRRLLEAGRTEDALLLTQINLNVNRYSTDSFLMAGEINLANDPDGAEFPMRGAVEVWNALEQRAAELEAWMSELHQAQPVPTEERLEVEMNHARAHALRGEKALAREVYSRVLAVDPEHAAALEGLRLLGPATGGESESGNTGGS